MRGLGVNGRLEQGLFRLGSVPELVFLLGGGIGYIIARRVKIGLGYSGVSVGCCALGRIHVGSVVCVKRMQIGDYCI